MEALKHSEWRSPDGLLRSQEAVGEATGREAGSGGGGAGDGGGGAG